MLDEWEMLYLGTGIVMCRRITTDRMSDPSSVHGGHGALGTGEQVQVHANVPGGRGKFLPTPSYIFRNFLVLHTTRAPAHSTSMV